MPKDRLTDLRSNVIYDVDQVSISIASSNGFFDDANKIRADIETLHQNIGMVERLQSRVVNSSGSEETQLRNQLDEQMDQTKSLISKIRRDLKIMAQRINEDQSSKTSTEMRIKRAQYTSLSTIFSEHSKNYNKVQVAYFESSKKRFQRQLEISGVIKNDDEINEMIHSGNIQVFNAGVLAETKMARQQLADVEQRHREIMKLEKDIIDLQEMFVDFAALIQDQGQMINRIEDNMIKVDQNVDVAVEVLPEAVKHKKAAGKKKMIIIGIVAVVIIIIIVILVIAIPKR